MKPFPFLRIANIEDEISFEASKWLKVPVLLDEKEMSLLLKELGTFSIFSTSSVQKKGEGLFSHEEFLNQYTQYTTALKGGQLPNEAFYRSFFSSVFTVDPNHLYILEVQHDKQLIRIAKPVIQLQAHLMDYSPLDGKFRSMMFGSSITWGILFSFPQIYKNPLTRQVDQVLTGASYPNGVLFKTLQKWIRHYTVTTPFLVDGRKISAPIRLGKQCFSWINQHPQLIRRGIRVKDS